MDPAARPAKAMLRPNARPLVMGLNMLVISSFVPRLRGYSGAENWPKQLSNGNAEWLSNRYVTAIAREY
jgi:hypothetical protein